MTVREFHRRAIALNWPLRRSNGPEVVRFHIAKAREADAKPDERLW